MFNASVFENTKVSKCVATGSFQMFICKTYFITLSNQKDRNRLRCFSHQLHNNGVKILTMLIFSDDVLFVLNIFWPWPRCQINSTYSRSDVGFLSSSLGVVQPHHSQFSSLNSPQSTSSLRVGTPSKFSLYSQCLAQRNPHRVVHVPAEKCNSSLFAYRLKSKFFKSCVQGFL